MCLCGRPTEHQVSSSVAPHFISETGSLTDSASKLLVCLSALPVPGLQVHETISGFYSDVGDPNAVKGPDACTAGTKP